MRPTAAVRPETRMLPAAACCSAAQPAAGTFGSSGLPTWCALPERTVGAQVCTTLEGGQGVRSIARIAGEYVQRPRPPYQVRSRWACWPSSRPHALGLLDATMQGVPMTTEPALRPGTRQSRSRHTAGWSRRKQREARRGASPMAATRFFGGRKQCLLKGEVAWAIRPWPPSFTAACPARRGGAVHAAPARRRVRPSAAVRLPEGRDTQCCLALHNGCRLPLAAARPHRPLFLFVQGAMVAET